MLPHAMRFNILSPLIVFALIAVGCSKDDSINAPSGITTATIYLENTQQVIRGFGAANIVPWRPDMTTDQINKAFGTGDGQIGLSILRLRVPHDQSEFSLNVPTAQLTKSLGVTIIASPWTPPAWMKSNNNIVGGILNDTSYASYAAHLKSFADYMAGNGVVLDGISIQNEPDVRVSYESCDWSASQMLKFIKFNAPSIGTKIIVPESFNLNRIISDAILNDSAAAANVSIIGEHIYGGGISSYPLAVSKGKELWMTEHLDTNRTWSDVIATAKEINDCMNAGMSAYIWWYIVRFYGPILEDGTVSKRGFVMSQYARFIRPGFYRVGATANPQTNVDVTAYKDGSKVVIVVVNRNSSEINQLFIIKDGNVNTLTSYITSNTLNCSQQNNITVLNGNFLTSLAASSITTFVSN